MGNLDRRHALVTFAAVGAGVLAASAPEPMRPARPGEHRAKTEFRTSRRTRPDPGYARGRPMRALRRPVHTLHDVTPAAPPNAVALTIDDGPDRRWTPMVLDLLAEFGVPATFFVVAEQVKEFPALVQRMVAAGHQIADHTVTHPMDLPGSSPARIREEIGGARDRIAQTTGVTPRWFRAPGGAWTARIMDTAAEHGMVNIDWEVDTRDWTQPGARSIESKLLGAKAGDVLLCHDGGGDRSGTVHALRRVIPVLKQRGLTFVAL
ncbi:polysaccharide deacetylase family protein [Actinomadura sp. HBU206391]|uniref:polysaccharide deacetylase family protein n=1 Tax=Actinomadura sp. HBU206391 TaxID=2731692 RepID=UPI001650917D|nr:polysaccharide deacetylase family protein [Actinomadura sp. HBU206391]MBC6462519.1 polysaccharide deacetylase family protein [Actinomadura sp. HBU206391]